MRNCRKLILALLALLVLITIILLPEPGDINTENGQLISLVVSGQGVTGSAGHGCDSLGDGGHTFCGNELSLDGADLDSHKGLG